LDRVISYPAIPTPEVGAPLPLVASDESTVAVAFVADNRSVVVVRFPGFAAYMFGQPNDEAFTGHPLESQGLEPYSAYEVVSSSWIRSLERQNSVHPQHDPQKYARLKHFVIAFHDSTLECVAETALVSVHKVSMKKMWSVLKDTFDARVV